MSGKTSIEWTDATWNPVRGCSRVSEGCRNCYAEGIAARFNKSGQAFEGLAEMVTIGKGTPAERTEPHWTGKVRLVEEHLNDPLRWKKPRRVFVNSMSDLFHEELSFEIIAKVFAVMALAQQHTFQVLTKRPERAVEFFKWIPTQWAQLWPQGGHPDEIIDANVVLQFVSDEELGYEVSAETDAPLWPLPNVWLGISVENQKAADERIPLLIKTPAAVRFLSIEPLLSPVDLDRWVGNCEMIETDGKSCASCIADQQIHWVIVGGESGRGARPMHPQWARDIQNQCDYAGIPFFFKQWGEWASEERDGAEVVLSTLKSNQLVCAGSGDSTHTLYTRVGKLAAGRKLDGVEHSAFPAASL